MKPASKRIANHRRRYRRDRFSDLPDSIVHHIFSFLDMEVYRLSFLSKRCHQLCITSPYLHFTSDFYSAEARRQFSQFLQRFISLRNEIGNNEIGVQRFHLNWFCQEDEETMIDSLIEYAVECNVQEIDLRLWIPPEVGSVYVLPGNNFRCLRELKLTLGIAELEFPLNFFVSLEVLALHSTKISSEFSLGDWISCFCRSVKRLSLCNIRGMKEFTITSSSLEELTISTGLIYDDLTTIMVSAENLRALYLSFRSHKIDSLKFSAPNLQDLIWAGKIGDFCCLENLISLQNTTLNFEGNESYKFQKSLVELLESVSSTRVLELNMRLIETLFAKDHLPILFENLHHLDIKVRQFKNSHVPAIVSLLMGLINLETLTIKSDLKSSEHSFCGKYKNDEFCSKESDSYKNYGESQDLQSIHGLKKVEIELGGTGNEIELVKVLLKSAIAIQKMTIFCSESDFDLVSATGIENFETASSNAAVSIQLKKFDHEQPYM